MGRNICRGIRILFSLLILMTVCFSRANAVQADIRVYRDDKGVLYITNSPSRRVPAKNAKKTNSAPFTGRLIDVKKELARPRGSDRFVHDSSTKAAIHVYRDKQGTLLFTNVPNRPGYRPFLLLHSYASRLGRKDSVTFDRLIQTACQRYGVEFALVKAVIKAESAFDPWALSHAGARGLMQLMPDTAAMHGVADIHAPRDNIEGGVRHLRLLLDQFEWDVQLALAAYNAGAGAVTRYNGIPPYQETQDYVRRVLRYRESYREQSRLMEPLA
jgi:soluble lytic murein transglycosylase